MAGKQESMYAKCKRSTNNANKGFTLVELIVVLIVLAILAAILIPSMVGWIKKAKNRDAILECRAVVTATQTKVAEYYGEGVSTIISQLNEDATLQEIQKIAGVEAADDIRTKDIRVEDNGQVSYLNYTTKKDITVIYDIQENPPYVIESEDVAISGPPAYHEQVITIKNDPSAWSSDVFLVPGTTNTVKEEYKDLIKNYEVLDTSIKGETKRLQAAYKVAYGFPEVDWTEIGIPAGVAFSGGTPPEAVWKPIVTAEREVIMIATTNANVGNGLTAVIYYNGDYYYHGHSENRLNMITLRFVDVDFSLSNLEKTDECWVKISK